MGVVVDKVVFAGEVPTAARIAERVTAIVGHPVLVTESEPRDDLRDLSASLAFEGFPNSRVELTAYRVGAVEEYVRQLGMEKFPIAKAMEGAGEAADRRTVHIRAYIGQELTLFAATILALEALGGRPNRAVGERDRLLFGRSVDAAELTRRQKRVVRQGWLMMAVGVLLLPVLVPVGAVSVGWYLVRLPQSVAAGAATGRPDA